MDCGDVQSTSRGFRVLCSVYSEVTSLKKFLSNIVDIAVLQNASEKSQRYEEFLQSMVVASSRDARPMQGPVSLNQESYQHEVIFRVIQRLLGKCGRSGNILTLGFRKTSNNPDSKMTMVPSVEQIYPNTNTRRLQDRHWKTLLQSVGDQVMSHLLETRSIFLPLSKGNFVQLTGVPCYEILQEPSIMMKRFSDLGVRSIAKEGARRQLKKSALKTKTRQRKLKITKMRWPGFLVKRIHCIGTSETGDTVTSICGTTFTSGTTNSSRITSGGATRGTTSNGTDRYSLQENSENVTGLVYCRGTKRCSLQEKPENDPVPVYHRGTNRCSIQKDQENVPAPVFHRGTKRCSLQENTENIPAPVFHRGTKRCSLQEKPENVPVYLRKTKICPIQENLGNVPLLVHHRGTRRRLAEEENAPENGRAKCTVAHIDRKRKYENNCELPTEHPKRRRISSTMHSSKVKNMVISEKEPCLNISVASSNLRNEESQSFTTLRDSNNSEGFQNRGSRSQSTVTRAQSQSLTTLTNSNNGTNPKKSQRTVNRAQSQSLTILTDSNNGTGPQRSLSTVNRALVEDVQSTIKVASQSEASIIEGEKDEMEPYLKKKRRRRRKGEEVKLKGKPYNHHLQISRTDIFYAKDLRSRLPARNIMLSLTADEGGARRLLASICYDTDVGSSLEPSRKRLVEKAPLQTLKVAKEKMSFDHPNTETHSKKNDEKYTSIQFTQLKENCMVSDHFTENKDGGKTIQDGGFDKGKGDGAILSNPRRAAVSGIDPRRAAGRIALSSLSGPEECSASENTHNLDALTPMLKQVIKNHRGMKYLQMLRHHCPVNEAPSKISANQEPGADGHGRGLTNQGSQKELSPIESLLQQNSPVEQVLRFLGAVCHRVFPQALWGSNHNRNTILRHLKEFLLLGRYERTSLGRLMEGMKTKDCLWLKNVPSQQQQTEYLAKLVFWVFNNYLLPLLKGFFYISEMSTHRNRIFYFRKTIWAKLQQKGTQDYIKQDTLKQISKEEAHHLLKAEQALGLSYLRFLPKADSLRPIINMGRQPTKNMPQVLPINKQLINLFHVLTYLKVQRPSVLGSSLFGPDNVYGAWLKFVKKRRCNNDNRRLYFVKVDIRLCFDTIDPHRLYQIIQKLFLQADAEEYIVRKYVTVLPSRGKLRKSFCKQVSTLDNFTADFNRFVRKLTETKNLRNAIVVDQVVNQHEGRDELLGLLRKHLFSNIIKIGDKFFVQKKGIAQGSILSTLLCNYYYGNMEAEELVVKGDELLMRQVDDFLFVTPHLENARLFLGKLQQGFPAYNCQVNHRKTLTNFSYTQSTELAQVSELKDTEFFPWCGFLFNMRSLEVHVDYSRYRDVRMMDAVTFDLITDAGTTMKSKLLSALKPKCLAIFLDPEINSESAILKNVYEMFLLCAFKFHSIVSRLPAKQRVQSNPQFFLDVITDVARCLQDQANRRLTDKISGNMTKFPLTNRQSLWLCIRAFSVRLNKHRAQYCPLVRKLRNQQRVLERSMDSEILRRMRSVADEELPPDFRHIKS